MRSEKELWQVVLSRPDLFSSGLCAWVLELAEKNIINLYEHYKLIDEIRYFRQQMKKPNWATPVEALYWIGKPGDLQARIDWINGKISKL